MAGRAGRAAHGVACRAVFDMAEAAVEGALAAGARYADARVMVIRTESIGVRNGVVERLRSAGVEVVRASIDSFHNPRRVRLPAGVDLAESYVERSHDLDALRRLLLEPFRSGGTYRAAAFDVGADRPVEAPALPVPPSSVLLLDGLFLHREELAGWWDRSILLLGPSRPTAEASRGLGRAPVGSAGLLHLAWWAALAHRYLDGWRRYEERCEPARVADLVVDNDDLAAPRILRRP